MVKHYEQLWNEAEEIALHVFENENIDAVATKAGQILHSFVDLDDSEKSDKLGEVLFRLCWLAHKCRLNSYNALRNKLNDYKIDVYEPDIMSE